MIFIALIIIPIKIIRLINVTSREIQKRPNFWFQKAKKLFKRSYPKTILIVKLYELTYKLKKTDYPAFGTFSIKNQLKKIDDLKIYQP